MNDLIEIQKQIDKLKRQADAIKSRDFDSAVQEIVVKMRAFGITVQDLRNAMGKKSRISEEKKGAKRRGKAVLSKPKKTTTTLPPKYKGPNGEVWSGRGLMPRWLAALVAQGHPKEGFAVAP